MNPSQGHKVKVLFNNGVTIEGVVDSWSDQKSVLSCSDNSFFVIQKTLEDVLAVKIIKTKEVSQAHEEFKELAEKPRKTKEDLMTLGELKNELNKQERENFFNRIRSHEPSGASPPAYSNPFVLNKKPHGDSLANKFLKK